MFIASDPSASSIVVAAVPLERVVPAFAAPSGGGFGGGSSGGFAKKTSKKAKGKKQNPRGLISEVDVSKPLTSKPKQENDDHGDGDAKLDKWGLPIPTVEDIFPPMPPGTELIPVNSAKEDISLSDIKDAMKDHIELDNLYTRFDETGVEKNPPLPGRKSMKLRLLHRSPPVLAVENFFTKEECENVKRIALEAEKSQRERDLSSKNYQNGDRRGPVQVKSATFSALAQSKRSSTSWFCYYSQVPVLLAKAHHVLGIRTLEQMEEPQIVRYKTGEEFSWHYDEVPSNQLKNGGQRLVTLLVYLNDVGSGGGTVFRDLQDGITGEMLTMKPKLGSALMFFPAFKNGRTDDRSLHKGDVAGDEKWIIQMWIHEKPYVASIPEGNFQQAAKEAVEEVSKSLGYQ